MTDMALTPVIAVDSVEVPGLARDTVTLAVHGGVRRATRLRLTVLSSPDALVDPVDGRALRVTAVRHVVDLQRGLWTSFRARAAG
jgi:hypothetical protein